jgi:hypothetical protein
MPWHGDEHAAIIANTAMQTLIRRMANAAQPLE